MPSHAMSSLSQALYADRDDPFMASRMASHAALGVPQSYNFSRVRRRPATIAERFTLIKSRV